LGKTLKISIKITEIGNTEQMKVTQKKKKVAKIPNNKKQFRVFIGNLPP